MSKPLSKYAKKEHARRLRAQYATESGLRFEFIASLFAQHVARLNKQHLPANALRDIEIAWLTRSIEAAKTGSQSRMNKRESSINEVVAEQVDAAGLNPVTNVGSNPADLTTFDPGA